MASALLCLMSDDDDSTPGCPSRIASSDQAVLGDHDGSGNPDGRDVDDDNEERRLRVEISVLETRRLNGHLANKYSDPQPSRTRETRPKEDNMGKNTAVVKVENQTGEPITEIQYSHRYDEDVYNVGNLPVLGKGENGSIGIAIYWTGFLRTGKDYWWIQFNRGGALYTCKANFYCFLTSDDATDGGPVKLILKSHEMTVTPPKSDKATVSLYKSDALSSALTEGYAKADTAAAAQAEVNK
jgi:hypothetical protein